MMNACKQTHISSGLAHLVHGSVHCSTNSNSPWSIQYLGVNYDIIHTIIHLDQLLMTDWWLGCTMNQQRTIKVD